MDLRKAPGGGFTKYGDTYCCRGCGQGTGCTCAAAPSVQKSFRRPGDIGQRNPENSTKANNYNAEATSSSEPIGKRQHATKERYQSRDQRQWEPRSKRLKTQNKPRDSTREQARGRSEQRGQLSLPGKTKSQERISRTGSKGK